MYNRWNFSTFDTDDVVVAITSPLLSIFGADLVVVAAR